MVTILNAAVITTPCTYQYSICTTEQARRLVAVPYRSAIGHESTAEVISSILCVNVKRNRIYYQQNHSETALVFMLKGRAPEGVILTAEEIEMIGYEFGILRRLTDDKNVE